MMKDLLLIQFDLHHKLYNNVLEGFTNDETNQRLHGDTNLNHVKYLAGHLLNSQYGLAKLAGIDADAKWNELFAIMGQSEAKDNIDYPGIAEIKAEWNQLHPPTRNGLEALTPEALNDLPPAPFDQLADSVGEIWAFINHHTAYHIGQIGLLRRGFGKAPMSFD